MALTPDYANRIIYSDASISDVVAFHDELRDIEVSEAGILSPAIHTYKEVPLGGGAIFPAVAFINGWTLQFAAGNWTVAGGNIDATINPVDGCYVKQTQSAAYAVSSALGGTSGPTAEEIATSVWQHNTGAAVATRLAEAWARLGLDPSAPLITGQTSITFGDVVMAMTGDATSTTVTRQ